MGNAVLGRKTAFRKNSIPFRVPQATRSECTSKCRASESQVPQRFKGAAPGLVAGVLIRP